MPLKDLPPQISEALQTLVQRVDTQAVADFVVVLLNAAAAGIPEGKAPVPKAEVTRLLAQPRRVDLSKAPCSSMLRHIWAWKHCNSGPLMSDCKPCSAVAQ